MSPFVSAYYQMCCLILHSLYMVSQRGILYNDDALPDSSQKHIRAWTKVLHVSDNDPISCIDNAPNYPLPHYSAYPSMLA